MKKRLFISLVVFIMILVSVSGCSKAEYDTPDGFTYAENEGSDYILVYPYEWVLERNDAGMISVYVSETDFSNVSVTVFTWTNDYKSLLEYVEKYYFEQFKNNFNDLDYKVNEDGTIKTKVHKVCDSDAVSFEYSAKFNETLYKFKTCIISNNGYIYSLTYTATSEKYDSHIEAVNIMIDNFQFKK